MYLFKLRILVVNFELLFDFKVCKEIYSLQSKYIKTKYNAFLTNIMCIRLSFDRLPFERSHLFFNVCQEYVPELLLQHSTEMC